MRTLAEGLRSAGPHTVVWDGRDARGGPAPAGIYFYRLEAEGKRAVRKLIRIE